MRKTNPSALYARAIEIFYANEDDEGAYRAYVIRNLLQLKTR